MFVYYWDDAAGSQEGAGQTRRTATAEAGVTTTARRFTTKRTKVTKDGHDGDWADATANGERQGAPTLR
jgi:hypothetical protein